LIIITFLILGQGRHARPSFFNSVELCDWLHIRLPCRIGALCEWDNPLPQRHQGTKLHQAYGVSSCLRVLVAVAVLISSEKRFDNPSCRYALCEETSRFGERNWQNFTNTWQTSALISTILTF